MAPHSVRKYFIVRLRNAFQSVDITVCAAPEGEPHPKLEAKFGKKIYWSIIGCFSSEQISLIS